MKVIKFEIVNFKGISSTTINLSDEIPGNIITLIGLNESGKTTILEALSHFFTEDEETATFVETVHQRASLQDLIPKNMKAAFTGRISIRALIELDDSDVEALREHFLAENLLLLNVASTQRQITLERAFLFEDSTNESTKTYWTVYFPLKKKREAKFRNYSSDEPTKTAWLSGINYLRKAIPRIVYFPTFLFDFPERIYLEGEEDSETNSYYRQVMQDVLDSQGDGLSIQKHIVDRIESKRSSYANPIAFFAHLLGLDEKSQIDAVAEKISNEMSRVIFGAWGDILGRTVTDKRVSVRWFLDSQKKNAPYLEISIVDGPSSYSLSERSLGFRWFFSFLLFTQFRKSRRDDTPTVFLFDEPAANLHSKAQIKLLESFAKIARGQTYIVYSTHSHYMVNPRWLEKAYIVENKAVDYEDKDEMSSFAIRKTDIRATKYRAFVAKNPSKTSYFQPVLDALEVAVSPLDPGSRAVIIEGKFDYHPFIYLHKKCAPAEQLNIYPAAGADGLGQLINLFRGRGIDFCIVLDDDRAGKSAKKRYMTELLLAQGSITTLGEISDNLKGCAFESIYQNDVKSAAMAFFKTSELTKRQYSLYFQELLATKAAIAFPETEKIFKPVSAWAIKAMQIDII